MTSTPSEVLDLVQGWPARDVVCFRGQEFARREAVGDEVVLDGLCAATTDAGVATANFTTPAVLAVAVGVSRVVHAGRAHDGEVVLLPGTRLRVVGQARSDDLVAILLTEVGSELDAEVGRLGTRPELADLLAELPVGRRDQWATWVADAARQPPDAFAPNGYVVRALQAAWAAICHPVHEGAADSTTSLTSALAAAVHAGDDTDTVAAIAGALLGGCWGASSLPEPWLEIVHGWPGLDAAGLRELAHAVVDFG